MNDLNQTGVELIAAERKRQIEAEGWTAEHDDGHSKFEELQRAADAYIRYGDNPRFPTGKPPACWPWEDEWWKPSSDHIRNLVKAGALIAAEIDRISRAESIRGLAARPDGGAT